MTSKLIPGSDFGHTRVLLVGDKNYGKTSIAFKIAYDASARGEVPLFICNKNKIESKLPMFTKVVPSEAYHYSPEILSRVHMKYVSAVTELKALIAGMHCFEPRPTLVVIDDFTVFLDPLFSVARNDSKFIDSCILLSAFLKDVLDHFDSTAPPLPSIQPSRNISSSTMLVITDDCIEPAFIVAMQQCVDSVLKIQRSSSTVSSFVPAFNPQQNRLLAGEALQLVWKKRWSRKRSDSQGTDDVIIYKAILCGDNVLTITV